jgi:1,4-dihydroxy-2-naphthoate octaprenyltransferase
MNVLKIYFLESRPQFLTLSVVLAFLGTVVAWYSGFFDLKYALLAGFGLVLTHASVNSINDYFDYHSGIDLATKRTPFSGGSGILPAKLLDPKQALWFGLISLIIATLIGIYFIIAVGWPLLPLLILAAILVIFYSPVILRCYWPEWTAGVGLGALPVLGMFFVQQGAYTSAAVIASIPSAFLVHNLLLLNEFPDVEADRQAKRKTLPITLGKNGAAIFYSIVALGVYVWIIGWVAAQQMPVWTLLALLTLPFTIKAIKGAFHHDDTSKLIPAMAANVMAVLLTQILIGIGYILDYII